jgi:hypothetical protein
MKHEIEAFAPVSTPSSSANLEAHMGTTALLQIAKKNYRAQRDRNARSQKLAYSRQHLVVERFHNGLHTRNGGGNSNKENLDCAQEHNRENSGSTLEQPSASSTGRA